METPGLLRRLARSREWSLVELDRAAAVWVRGDGLRRAIDLNDVASRLNAHPIDRSSLPAWLGPRARVFPALNLGIFYRAINRPDLALPEADRLWNASPLTEVATFSAATLEESGRLAEAVSRLGAGANQLWIDARTRRLACSSAVRSRGRAARGSEDRRRTRRLPQSARHGASVRRSCPRSSTARDLNRRLRRSSAVDRPCAGVGGPRTNGRSRALRSATRALGRGGMVTLSVIQRNGTVRSFRPVRLTFNLGLQRKQLIFLHLRCPPRRVRCLHTATRGRVVAGACQNNVVSRGPWSNTLAPYTGAVQRV